MRTAIWGERLTVTTGVYGCIYDGYAVASQFCPLSCAFEHGLATAPEATQDKRCPCLVQFALFDGQVGFACLQLKLRLVEFGARDALQARG